MTSIFLHVKNPAFAKDLSQKNSANSYLWLALLIQCLTSFSFINYLLCLYLLFLTLFHLTQTRFCWSTHLLLVAEIILIKFQAFDIFFRTNVNFWTRQGSSVFQFQTSEIFLFTGVQKLFGPKNFTILPCTLQLLDNLQRHLIFSNYIGEIDHFTLDLRKRSNTKPWTIWKVSYCGPSKRRHQRTRVWTLDYRWNSGPTEKIF